MVQATSIIKALATTAAVTAATLTGGPAAGASVAAFLASPPGQKVLDASLEQTARNQGVVLEDLARGGLVSRPTLGLTGEAGPEFVIPINPMRSEAEYMRLRDFARSTKNQQLENQLAMESGTRPKKFTQKRSRAARASDKILSRAFKEANAKLRNNNGQLKKGKTQADVARMAQKLRKKMGKGGTKKGQVRKTARRAFKK